MKAKLLALALLAGGSMFAQTRFSMGIDVGGSGHGYYTQAPPGRNVWVNGYWAVRPYNNGYQVTPGYNHGYAQQCFDRGGERNENRGFNRDRDRDDDNRGRGNERNFRPGNGYGNGFRGR